MTKDEEKAAEHAWKLEKAAAAEKAMRVRTELYRKEAVNAIDRLIYHVDNNAAEAWARVDALRLECETLRLEARTCARDSLASCGDAERMRAWAEAAMQRCADLEAELALATMRGED